MHNLVKIKKVLISVSDKTGLIEFVKHLLKWNVEIISTGGTLKVLHEAGIKAKSVSEFTGFPEILDGRVKTLHPKIFAGLLAISENPKHDKELTELSINSIDMVVVNLYPFEKTVSTSDVKFEDAIENIDIGGPSMLRAAAKNFHYKTVISNPARYNSVIEELQKNNGATSAELRFNLAREVFQHTSKYDLVISKYLNSIGKEREVLPDTFSVSLRKISELRYGENPHQKAALYGDFYNYFEKLHGKELSFNNIIDIQAAVELVQEFEEPTVVIIKHTNPCGVGSAKVLAEAYKKAFETDTKAAFGGIVAFNRALDVDTANLVNEIFTEVLIAPDYPRDVFALLTKKKDRRLIRQIKSIADDINIKKVVGGLLVQEYDKERLSSEQIKIVTKRQPTEEEMKAMFYGWHVIKHLKSNAIVFSKSDRTIGIGAGQMSRIDSVRIAILKAKKAKLDLDGTVMASDGFFPFPDGVKEAVKVGATAIIQPGGSIRDADVIKAADDKNVAMVFTGIRHFKH